MRTFLLVALTMCAFAGNSILNRLGVAGYGMDPMDFAVIRVLAGAVTLWALVRLRGGAPAPVRHWGGAVTLAVYMLGFSWAYLSLGAGVGALILFGVVQLAMFGWAVRQRQSVPGLRWLGAVVAFGGLVLLLWPAGGLTVPLAGALSMAAAGAAWAGYTLLGQGAANPLAATAVNFGRCVPLVLPALLLGDLGRASLGGVLVAVTAGAVTSGLGYALWYRVLPGLAVSVAAITQLSVPVIAVAAGALLLGEPVTARLVLASALVLGGIALSLVRR